MAGVEHQLIGLESVIGALDRRDVQRAHFRALQLGARRGRVTLSQETRKQIPVSARSVKQAVQFVPPRNGQPGFLQVVSPSTPLSELKPRQRRDGFSVEIEKGRRVPIKGAFQIPKAGRRLFKRDGTFGLPKKGRYAGRGIKREGIQQLFTRSITQAADDAEVLDKVVDVVNEASRAEFVRQIQLMADKA